MLTALALSRDPSLTEGLKEIRADILIGKLKTREEVEEAIRRAVQSGKLSREALDKFLSDSGQFGFNALSRYQFSNDLCYPQFHTGCSENELAKSLLIEGALAQNGATANKITSALENASLPGGTHDLGRIGFSIRPLDLARQFEIEIKIVCHLRSYGHDYIEGTNK